MTATPTFRLIYRSHNRIPDDQRKAFDHDRTACVVGRDLAIKQNFHVGDRVTLVGDIFPGDFQLVAPRNA